MAWSGDTFTRTNGVNTGTTVWDDDKAAGVKIRSDRHDTHDQDLADGINACLKKDGANTATQINVDNLRLDGNTISSTNANGNILIAPNGSGYIGIDKYGLEYQAHGNMGTTETIDLDNAVVHEGTMDDDCTFTFSNPPASGRCGQFLLILNQDVAGSHTATWPASVKWAGGSAPTLSTGATDIDILAFFTVNGGTTWYGTLIVQDAA